MLAVAVPTANAGTFMPPLSAGGLSGNAETARHEAQSAPAGVSHGGSADDYGRTPIATAAHHVADRAVLSLADRHRQSGRRIRAY
jgi:hypothetical protein